MKLMLSIVCIFLLAVPAALADVNVSELLMDWQQGETVVKIDVSGPSQFSHQLEIAKDGKPFRVIVDVFPAIHNLGQKNFPNLPNSVVRSIRTSQYATKPANTVRIVMDLNEESAYRIDKAGNMIYVYITDPTRSGFSIWSSKNSVMPEESVIESAGKPKPEPIIAEKSPEAQTVLMPADPAKAATQPAADEPVNVEIESPTAPAAENASPQTTYHKPKRSNEAEKELTQPVKPRPKTDEPQVAKKTELVVIPVRADGEKEAVEAAAKPILQVVGPEISKETAARPAEEPSIKVDKAVKVSAEIVESNLGEQGKPNSSIPESVAVEPKKAETVSTVVPEPTDVNLMDLVEASEPFEDTTDSADKPTSRFRREPTFPAKLKGTIVAEFPQRMVIQYASSMSRDPFSSLIEEGQRHKDPLLDRIPDVETARLVGVLENVVGENRALLEDIDGYGFILKTGDKVKKGYVSEIYADRALFQLFEYGWSRTIALRLNEDE